MKHLDPSGQHITNERIDIYGIKQSDGSSY